MEILKCQGIEKTYGRGESRTEALRGIDLSVGSGELVSIVGPSGSGKSTLLHIIGCIDRADAGKIVVDGVDVSALSPTEAAVFRRRRVGIVYQFYNLIPTLTVEQNILLPMKLDKKQPEAGRYDELVDTLGLREKLRAVPAQLSGGQQQRAAIARAMLYRPALLLCDEPTGNLDRENSREIVRLLRSSNRSFGQTILLVTHDETVAAETDRTVTIEDGRITGDVRRG